MATVTIPAHLEAELRAHEGDWETELGQLVVRALLKYLCLCERRGLSPEDRERLMRHAEARRAAMESVGLTEEEILEDFEGWRRSQRRDTHR